MAEFQHSGEQFYYAFTVISSTVNSSNNIGYVIDAIFIVLVVTMVLTHIVQGLQPAALLLWLLQHCQAPLV